MGYAIANVLAEKGANVTLISGPSNARISSDTIKRIDVVTASEMYEACIEHFPESDGTIMAAAIADFTPEDVAQKKIKSQEKSKNLQLNLVPTKDIAFELGKKKKKDQLLIGFALETNEEIQNARKKLDNKNLDFIVLNSLRDKGAGFGHYTNKITIIHKDNKRKEFELKSKHEVAEDIVNELEALI